jgi:hypothetical protein
MEKSKVRKPAVAGQFYPASPAELKQQIGSLVAKDQPKIEAIAVVLPHAGYMYSGGVAAQTVSRLNIKDKIILLGPNHTGYGPAFSIMSEGVWQTPLGEVKIDSTLAQKILSQAKYLEEDDLAHIHEHSLEVELPFLQYFKSDFEIVPIVVLSDDLATLKEIGSQIAGAVKDLNSKDAVMLLASSDFTHYEPQAQAAKKDKAAIQAIIELDEDKLMSAVRRLSISMCGYAPVIVMLSAAKTLGAKTGQLIAYQTSGDVTGDKSSVVGYAGILIQ